MAYQQKLAYHMTTLTFIGKQLLVFCKIPSRKISNTPRHVQKTFVVIQINVTFFYSLLQPSFE